MVDDLVHLLGKYKKEMSDVSNYLKSIYEKNIDFTFYEYGFDFHVGKNLFYVWAVELEEGLRYYIQYKPYTYFYYDNFKDFKVIVNSALKEIREREYTPSMRLGRMILLKNNKMEI
jgi:hypothetical protein